MLPDFFLANAARIGGMGMQPPSPGSPTSMMKRVRTCQRAMERIMLGVQLYDTKGAQIVAKKRKEMEMEMGLSYRGHLGLISTLGSEAA